MKSSTIALLHQASFTFERRTLVLRSLFMPSNSFYSYGEYGERALVNYADRPCRINTYGDSFTACGQTR